MTVVGLHPEELFDKLQSGELSPLEAERLRQHLQGCDVCRFDYAARLDFQEEALQLASLPPPSLPLRPLALPGLESASPAPRVTAPRRRARRRLLMVGLAAAALISASAALAASLTGRAPWRALAPLFSERAPQATALAKVNGASRPRALRAPTSPAQAPSAEAPPPAVSAVQHASAENGSPAPRRLAAPSERSRSQVAPSALPTPAAAEAPPKEPSSAAKLFADANQARRSGDIGRASGLYRLLQEQHSGSPEAELSRVTLALLQLDSGDPQAALAGFERYLAGSSRGLEAEALVGRARALGRLGRRSLEVSAWQEVQRKYPRSVYGRQASERLSALGQP